LFRLSAVNPFTQAVELIRFALYGRFNGEAALYTLAALALFLGAAIYAYDPARGMMGRRGGSGG
ncbi:MAG: multidrug ABC transporter permease, partial [Proteobacteria bacterium]|nr:multidrug ABC transporter permease [Pseudomonadota bacterium]